jgi:hypothetical protein
MVGHQHVGVDRAAVRYCRFAEPATIQRIVLRVEEDRRAVVAALNDVLRLIPQDIGASPLRDTEA